MLLGVILTAFDLYCNLLIRVKNFEKGVFNFLFVFVCFRWLCDEIEQTKWKPYKEWLVVIQFISVRYIIILTQSSAKNPYKEISWMTIDALKKLSSKRVIYLVCSRGRSSSSDLMILCSSLLGENSCVVFWVRL